MSDLPILSASRLKDARACQRMHYYKYLLGYRPAVEAEVLRFGSLGHLGLEAWWRAEDADAALQLALEAMAGEADPFERAKAEALIIGYDARWAEDRALYRVLGVEAQFTAPLVNPETGRLSQTWQLGGKLDVLVEEVATGRAGVVEHKFTAEDMGPGTDYWRRLKMDPQVSQYFTGGEALLRRRIEFCLYDVIRRPAQRPKKKAAEVKLKKDGTPYANQQLADETPDEFRNRLLAVIAEDPAAFYARGEVVRLQGEVEEALFDVWQVGQQLREAERRGRYPRNPGACLSYGRTCPFLAVCCGEGSLDDPSLFRKSEHIHPELNHEGANGAA